MIKVRFPLLLYFLMFTVLVFPQDQVKVDSLKKLLKKAKIDTVKADLLNQLFEEHINGDTSMARDFANQAFRLSSRSEYSRGIANYYLNLANLELARENYRKARNYIQRSIDLYEDVGDLNAVATGYHGMGHCLFLLQDYNLSLEYYNESLKIREEIRDTSGLKESYKYLGSLYNRHGNFPLALEHFHKLLALCEAAGDARGMAECYNSIGWNLSNQGNNTEALVNFQKALETFEALGDSFQMATAYNYIGIVHSELGNYPKSLEYFQKSLGIRESLGDSSTIADCMNNMGLIYEYQGDYPRALEIYFETCEYREKLGERSRLGLCYHNIGNIYYKMDDTTRALNYYKRALAIRTELGERGPMASTYIGLGNVNLDKEEYSRALENYGNGLEIFRESGDKTQIVICLMNIGLVNYRLGNYPAALDNYEQALKIAEEIGSIRRTALINGKIGSVYLKMNEYYKAIGYGLKGYHLGSDAGVKEAVRDAAEILAGSYAATGSYRKAYDYYNIFKTLSDSLLNADNIRDITTRENRYQYEKEQQITELENLKREEVHAAEVKKQQVLRNAFIAAFVLMIIIAALILRSSRLKQKANIALQEKNIYISQQKEEIEAQKDEIEQQKEELQMTLDHLRETQEQLIQSEKLAALGGLVAGVAHEINTPVGISVTAASSLAEETSRMAEQYVTNKISRAEFKEYLNTTNQSAKLILANMERTAAMVQSFKQVSVDQSTEQKRKFKLKEYTEDIIRSLYPKLKGKKVKIKIEMDDQLELNSYPGAFSQILTNLVLNSLVHGFENKDQGNINISVRQEDGNLLLEYRDDGKGIANQNLNKIFDPFFTTNNKIGTGLGLHIVYNIVTQKLNGSITCNSEREKGVSFILKIPVQ
jgi:signal transduction histidine kinase/Tfp pilus assembly protein PilF